MPAHGGDRAGDSGESNSPVERFRNWLAGSDLDWFPEVVIEEFGFLRDYGYDLADVHLHFQGNSVSFRRADSEIIVTYGPESTGLLEAPIWHPPDGEPRTIDLDHLITARIPGAIARAKRPLNRQVVERYVRFSGQGLKEIAPGLLDGPLPPSTGAQAAEG